MGQYFTCLGNGNNNFIIPQSNFSYCGGVIFEISQLIDQLDKYCNVKARFSSRPIFWYIMSNMGVNAAMCHRSGCILLSSDSGTFHLHQHIKALRQARQVCRSLIGLCCPHSVLIEHSLNVICSFFVGLYTVTHFLFVASFLSI